MIHIVISCIVDLLLFGIGQNVCVCFFAFGLRSNGIISFFFLSSLSEHFFFFLFFFCFFLFSQIVSTAKRHFFVLLIIIINRLMVPTFSNLLLILLSSLLTLNLSIITFCRLQFSIYDLSIGRSWEEKTLNRFLCIFFIDL